eukprot:gnl/MRDRNA2_/MRDRNA2_297647_c0_seq1.p2 gnl/MRDRNA2_/MRDRNA2_297647_c0~~gnl/MRDRNA2_/MRDRNA2_297647_c0_seq1.p2  ORF type:complete len:113 (-),score=10.68 gnl/MRDRNA2_/MRDRNA2_297647_c0_seq1:159-497(-)
MPDINVNQPTTDKKEQSNAGRIGKSCSTIRALTITPQSNANDQMNQANCTGFPEVPGTNIVRSLKYVNMCLKGGGNVKLMSLVKSTASIIEDTAIIRPVGSSSMNLRAPGVA